tara:strand:- start:4160 stop:5326 length:1167 start_codon:yes stop_codon:yes gene_type:complete
MTDNIIYSEPNKTLVTQEDNKALWNLPKYRRTGYRDLYKINRYGLILRSDHVLKLNKTENSDIENISLVKDMTNQSSFCSLIVGKGQTILYEKFATDFHLSQPQTIMSITKMFINLLVGELVEQNMIDLNQTVSKYLPNIGSGYADATIQNVLNMNVKNNYTEDYTDPFSSSFLQEKVGGWRIPDEDEENTSQENFLNSIETIPGETLENGLDQALYKSANTDVIAMIIENITKISLRDHLIRIVEAAGFEDALYMATDRGGMPWLSGGGCLTTRDFLRMGLLFSRRGKGIKNRCVGSKKFIESTLKADGPKYMRLLDKHFVFYANQTMKSNNWIGHSGYGGQFLMINLETNVVAAFFSVLETKSATDETYKSKMILMLEEITSKANL